MSKLIGTDPNQVPSNADLGTLAYIDANRVGELSVKTLNVGDVTHDKTEDYNLTIARTAGGSGVLKLYGDNYYAGNPHVRWQLEPTSGAALKSGLMTFDGDFIKTSALKIDTTIGADHVSGQGSMEIYHYNYPDDNTSSVPALRIRSGNSSADLRHHGYLSLEQIFTGGAYESPRLYFINRANGANDKAVVGLYTNSGTTPSLNIIGDLLGSSEETVDLSESQMAQFSSGSSTIRNAGHNQTPILRLHQTTTRFSGLVNGIEFRDSQNETNASITVSQGSAGNSSGYITLRADDGDGGNGLVDPPIGLQINYNGIRLTAEYTAYYSYASTWVTSYQQLIPNNTLGPNGTYLITIDTNNDSFGGHPYYAAAAAIIRTSPGTNGNGNNTASSFVAPTAAHVATSARWEFTVSQHTSGRNGLVVRLLDGPTFSAANGTQIAVRAFRLH
jgi:hypothetical protein